MKMLPEAGLEERKTTGILLLQTLMSVETNNLRQISLIRFFHSFWVR